MDWTNHFGQVLSISKKSIRARWGLTFSITEHCFGHQIVNFSGICVNLVGRLTLAIIGDKIKNGLNEPLWTSFIYFQKKYPHSMRLNFFDHRTLFLSPNRQFQSNCAHCWWAGSTLSLVWDKIKKMTERTTLVKFCLFPKKVSTLD